MFKTLTTKTADRILDVLTDGNSANQRRALKSVRAFRRNPTPEGAETALEYLAALDDNTRAELRQAARL